MHFFSADLKKETLNFSLAIHRVTDIFSRTEPLRLKLRERALEIVVYINTGVSVFGGSHLPPFHDAFVSIEILKDLILVSRGIGLMKAVNADVLYRECSILSGRFRQEFALFENDIEKRHNVVLGHEAHIHRNAEGHKEHIGETGSHIASSWIDNTGFTSLLGSAARSVVSSGGSIRAKEQMLRASSPSAFTVNDIIKNSTNSSQGERKEAIIEYLRANKEARIAEFVNIFSNRFSVKTLQRDLSRLILDQKVSREGDKRWAVYRIK